MLARSLIQKKRPAVLTATGLYPKRNSSISFSVFSAISYFFAISLDSILAFDSISIALESPNMSVVLLSVFNI
jgi:hypothetical protein